MFLFNGRKINAGGYIRKNSGILKWIGLILLVGYLSITWFGGDSLIRGGDFNYDLTPRNSFKRYSNVWDDRLIKESATSVAKLFPYQLLTLMMDYMGLSLVTSEKIFLYILFTSAGLSMFFLTISLIKDERRYLAGFVSALFFMMNPFTMMLKWGSGYEMSLFAYAVTPLILALYIRGINNQGGTFKSAFIIGIVSLFAAPSSTTPTYVILIWMPVFLYLFFYVLFQRTDIKRIIRATKFTLQICIVYLILNSWWILPVLSIAQARYELLFSGIEGGGISMNTLTLNSQETSLGNVMRFMYFWAFHRSYHDDAYFPYAEIYLSPLFIILSFLIPILAFSSLLYKKKDKHLIYFSFLSVLGIFLVKGIHPPLENIYIWLFKNFPGFRIFRMPDEKFGNIISLGYSFLIGYSISNIYRSTKIKLKEIRPSLKFSSSIIVVFILFLLFPVFMFPFWTGELFPKSPSWKFLKPATGVKIPNYYWEAGEWLNNEKGDFKVISLPMRTGSGGQAAAYNWGYGGADPQIQIFQQPMHIGRVHQYSAMLDPAYSLLLSNKIEEFEKFISLIGVRYILLHKDLDTEFFNLKPYTVLENLLKSDEQFQLVKSFGALDFYENSLAIPIIYSSDNIIKISGKISTPEIFKLYSETDENFRKNPPVMINLDENTKQEKIKKIRSQKTIVTLPFKIGKNYYEKDGWHLVSKNGPAITYYRQNPGDKLSDSVHPNGTISYNFSAPIDGNFAIYGRVRKDGSRGTLKYKVDNDSWSEGVVPSFGPVGSLDPFVVDTIRLGNSTISKGEHVITFLNTKPHYGKGYQDLYEFSIILNETLLSNESTVSSLIFEKINPSKYKLRINTSDPTLVVFSSVYHPSWKLYNRNVNWFEALWKKPIDSHILVNGYANGWIVDQENGSELTLYFQPQSIFYIGLLIAGIFGVIGTVIILNARHLTQEG